MPVKHGAQKRGSDHGLRGASRIPVLPVHVERLSTPISACRFEEMLRDDARN